MDRNRQLQLSKNLQKNTDSFTRQAVQGTHKLNSETTPDKESRSILGNACMQIYTTGEWLQPSRVANGTQITYHPPYLEREASAQSSEHRKAPKEAEMKHRMKNFDRRYSAKNLKPLSPGDMVWIPERLEGQLRENLALDLILSRQRMEHSEGITEILFSCQIQQSLNRIRTLRVMRQNTLITKSRIRVQLMVLEQGVVASLNLQRDLCEQKLRKTELREM